MPLVGVQVLPGQSVDAAGQLRGPAFQVVGLPLDVQGPCGLTRRVNAGGIHPLQHLVYLTPEAGERDLGGHEFAGRPEEDLVDDLLAGLPGVQALGAAGDLQVPARGQVHLRPVDQDSGLGELLLDRGQGVLPDGLRHAVVEEVRDPGALNLRRLVEPELGLLVVEVLPEVGSTELDLDLDGLAGADTEDVWPPAREPDLGTDSGQSFPPPKPGHGLGFQVSR